MATDSSSEILFDQAEIDSKPQKERPIGDKVLIDGAKVAAKGAVKIGKGSARETGATVRGAWRNRRDLSLVGVGLVAGAAFTNPEGARDISARAYHGALKQVENVKNIRGGMPSENAYNNLVEQNGGIIHTEYGDVTQYQKELVDIAIKNEKDNLDAVMTDEDWANVFKYEGLMKDTEDKYNLDDDFMGMVIQESHGDPYAESPVGAAGLAQLMPDFAEYFGLKVVRDEDIRLEGMSQKEIKDFRIKNDERYDPAKNLDAAAQSLSENIDKFKNKKFPYLVHHGGDGLVWGAVQKAIFDAYGYHLPDLLDVNIGSDDANFEESKRRLKEYQDVIEGKDPFLNGEVAPPVAVIDLFKTGKFTGEGSDGGDRYLYLIDGAKLLKAEKKAGIDKINSGQ